MSESQAVILPADRIDWPRAAVTLFPLLFFCAFMTLCTRGIFEATIGKALAYVAQLALWSLVQFAAIVFFRSRITPFLSAGIVLTALFGLSAMVSSIWTMNVSGFAFGIISALVNVY